MGVVAEGGRRHTSNGLELNYFEKMNSIVVFADEDFQMAYAEVVVS